MTKYAKQLPIRMVTPNEFRGIFLGMTQCQPIGLQTITEVEGNVVTNGVPSNGIETVQKVSHFTAWVNVDYAKHLENKTGVKIQVKPLKWGCHVTRDDGKKIPVIAHRKGQKLENLTVSQILGDFGIDELYVRVHIRKNSTVEYQYMKGGKKIDFIPLQESKETYNENDTMIFRTYNMGRIRGVKYKGTQFFIAR